MKKNIVLLLTSVALFCMNYALFAQASDIPRIFDYQGVLTNAQGEPYNGEFNITFAIINVKTDVVLYQETVENLQVENGLVHHLIGSVADTLNPFIFQNATTLRIKINEETLAPDVVIAPAPVALMALYADSINHAISQQEVITEKIHVSSMDTAIVAVSQNGPAIVAISGGGGGSRSLNKNKLSGGKLDGDGPVIVAKSDKFDGVLGESKDGNGMTGMSDNGDGVNGYSGKGVGVNGTSFYSDGVTGSALESGVGVNGSSNKGVGVRGHSRTGNGGSFTSEHGYAIYAKQGDGLGAAYFNGDVAIAGGLVLYGARIKMGKDGEIYARSFHTMKKKGYGGLAKTALQDTVVITSGIDSTGRATFTSVEAGAINSTSQMTALGGFVVNRSDGGSNRLGSSGIMFTDAGGINKGTWFSSTGDFITAGNYSANGTKNAIVNTESYGKRKLYSDESVDVRFFDRGESQLVNGKAIIRFDPMFLETVTIDKNNPALVQVTLTSDCNGVFVAERTATHFIVRELMTGASNASFMWEVSATRKGYESVRMEAVEPSVTLK